MRRASSHAGGYHRYHIHTESAPDIERWPSRFNVQVGKVGLAKHLIREIFEYRGNLEVILSRPCMYGVFSGPIGGFAPRPQHCVGCLRCTTEFPEFVRVSHNPARRRLGDSYFTFNYVDAISYEAQTGLVPVKGAGYRGKFGGEGWDGMWTDMSEIVRPTRDGIHGREFISTAVDIGYKPNFLVFDEGGEPVGSQPRTFSLPLPTLFDPPPLSVKDDVAWEIVSRTAEQIETLAVVPLEVVLRLGLTGAHIVPLVAAGQIDDLAKMNGTPQMIEMDGWDAELFESLRQRFPQSVLCLRTPFAEGEVLLNYNRLGVQVFHLTADYHGHGQDGRFVIDLIRAAHQTFVEAGIREEVTLLGSGGLIAAEHVPKAIICGLDAVALDTPLLVAMQGKFEGECVDPDGSHFTLPRKLKVGWGVQRLENLMASWRDQLLEILGAMGLREVRRLRGEMGRAMFMIELEAEAFAGIEGYVNVED